MIEPPKGAEIFNWSKHQFWYDESGILCGKSIKGELSELKDIQEFTEYFIKELNGKKVCVLHDFSNVSQSSREVRGYVLSQFPKFAIAVAMISQTPLGRMMANLFFSIKKQPYPTKMFDNEKEAKEWLKQYL